MNRINYKKILPVLCFVLITWTFTAHIAHAAILDGLINIGSVGLNVFLSLAAYMAYLVLLLSGQFLALCGTLFNVAMQLTVHLDVFINNAPVVYTVWAVIRDIASILLIFFILWAAIQMILDIKQPQFGSLLKGIIIAGILMNFSFFFARVAIDVSNIVSLQFYNAISPQQTFSYQTGDKLSTVISHAITDGSGGMSGIFMSALNVNKWWDNKGELAALNTSTESSQLIQMIISNYMGTLVQIAAGLSFLAGAIATLYRTIILVFLLAFSAIWIAAWAMPQLDEFKKIWMGHFMTNLKFLPAYLALMYVSVMIITKSDLNNIVNNISTTGNSSSAYLQLFIAFAIILFMINVPLLGAIAISGLKLKAVDSIKGWVRGVTEGATKNAVGWAGGYATRRTVGELARVTDEGLSKNRLGNTLLGRDIRAVSTGALAANKFGTKRSAADAYKAEKDVVKKDKWIKQRNHLTSIMDDPAKTAEIFSIIDPMNGKERMELGHKILNNVNVIKHLDQGEFDAIKKSEDLEFTDEIKDQIKNKRKEALKQSIDEAAASGEKKYLRHMVEELKGSDLAKLGDTLVNPAVVEHLKQSQLKELEDGGLDDKRKKEIGKLIADWTPPHRASGYVRKEHVQWLGT